MLVLLSSPHNLTFLGTQKTVFAGVLNLPVGASWLIPPVRSQPSCGHLVPIPSPGSDFFLSLLQHDLGLTSSLFVRHFS